MSKQKIIAKLIVEQHTLTSLNSTEEIINAKHGDQNIIIE